ncbi:MAG: hypothetical protein IK101_00585 [Oscillospiraceae bacterium]|nr:hypothetical protein [Oscillospiraceae bacterium]
MKKTLIIVLALVFSLAACAAKKPAVDPPEGYVISSREEIRPNYETVEYLSGCSEDVPDTLEGLAEKSVVAVKARLTAQDMLDPFTTEYTFTLLEDYFGTAEETMHLYTLGSDFFEVGGVYYVLMRRFYVPAWPHYNYCLANASFAVREYMLDGETVLVFRTELNFGMDESTDMSAELKKLAASMAEKGTLPAPVNMSLEELLDVAAVVEVVTVTETMYDGFGANRPNKYVVMADFTVDELLKGNAPVVPEEVPARVPYGTQVGDRFVVVFGKGITSTKFTSAYRVYSIDSEEAQAVLARFS